MKTAKEWATIYMISPVLKLEEAIKQAQSEAIEETVKVCAEAAKIQSKKLDNSDCTEFYIDKQSILNVEQQLKANL